MRADILTRLDGLLAGAASLERPMSVDARYRPPATEAPRSVVRHRLLAQVPARRPGAGLCDDRLCLMIFVAQWPRIARAGAYLIRRVSSLEGRLAACTLMALLLFVAPLVLYGLAGLSHVILKLTMRVFGAAATVVSRRRMVLFWALIAASSAHAASERSGGRDSSGPGIELSARRVPCSFGISCVSGGSGGPARSVWPRSDLSRRRRRDTVSESPD